jgi:hypothetical protein
LAIAILFIGALNQALPFLNWATPIQVVRGVFVDDALVILCVFLILVSGNIDTLFVDRRVRQFAWLVALLGGLGIISAGVHVYRVYDIGQALHLMLFAALFLVASSWARRNGSTWVLRWYLAGLVCGGAINLYLSFATPKLLLGVLPVLYMQNGAGGVLGLTVTLGAWLMLTGSTRLDTLLALASLLVGTGASAISYSKTSLSICAFGLIAWVFVFWHASAKSRRLRVIGPLCLALVLGGAVYLVRSSESFDVAATLVQRTTVKFSGLDLKEKSSVGARYMYFLGVLDILGHHPFTGVSYGGFYDAMTHTPAYQTGIAVDEDPETVTSGAANPHNSFLYYASANGVPGLVLVVGLFIIFLRHLWLTLKSYGWTGRIMWICLSLGYFIYANTLPTLYSTGILYVPAAVVLARLAYLRPAQSRYRTSGFEQAHEGALG